jgi:hypothetical protein
MLDALKALFLKETSLGAMGHIFSTVEELLVIVGEDYLKDKSTKNAAIDAICQLLQQHKDA